MNLEISGLTKRFGEHIALGDLNASVPAAGALALLGPSGGGKSTLLRILAGLLVPEAGRVQLDGTILPRRERELRVHRSGIGTVFQAFNLFPHLTALENIALPLRVVHGMSGADADAAGMALLERFKLSEHALKRPGALSGGQKQRVAIARAVSAKPRLLLFDEPTSALDPEMTAEVLDLIGELRAEGRDLVLVTHEVGFARTVADHVLFLGGGSVIEGGPAVEFFGRPQTPQAAAYLDRVLKY
jgi:polar amino acid transport system ATP-binding protein